jgi:protein ImuB
VTRHAFANRRFLALHFPFLAADRWKREQGGGARAEGPLVFIAKERGGIRLVLADADALSLGLQPGMTLADARARVPHLRAVDHDSHADARLLEGLAGLCDRHSPMVALDAPDGLVLDITGCAHLFGDETGLAKDVRGMMAGLGMRMAHAFADNPSAARALARFSGRPMRDETAAILNLPIVALGIAPEQALALRRAGLKRIGDLASRPTGPLSARFGPAVTAALQAMLGQTDSRITPRRPVPPLMVERRLAEPLTQVDFALDLIEDMLGEVARWLDGRHKGGRLFRVRFYRTDGEVRDLAVSVGRPSRNAAMVMRLFGERIAALADPIDPGFGFDLLRLIVPVVEPLPPDQGLLEGRDDAGEDFSALLDRLSARYGRACFRRFVPNDTHVPEHAAMSVCAVESASEMAPWPVLEAGEPPVRPMMLFDPPQPVEVALAGDPPSAFQWKKQIHAVVRYEGPERIAPEWWRHHESRQLPNRDYYRVEDAGGHRFWLFKQAVAAGVDVQGREMGARWYIHGLFA